MVCGKKEPLKITDKSSQEDNDGEELVTYKRGCLISIHVYNLTRIFSF